MTIVGKFGADLLNTCIFHVWSTDQAYNGASPASLDIHNVVYNNARASLITKMMRNSSPECAPSDILNNDSHLFLCYTPQTMGL